jgi:hypothetical protein
VSDAVLAAPVGVAVGALVNFAVTQLLDQQRRRRPVRGAGRTLKRDLIDALSTLHAGLEGQRWPPEDGHPFRLANWQELRVETRRRDTR